LILDVSLICKRAARLLMKFVIGLAELKKSLMLMLK